MNPDTVWAALIGAFVRALLLAIFTPLVTKGIIDDALLQRLLGEGGAQIVGVIMMALVLLWSWRNKILEWFKLRLALDAAPGTETPGTIAANAANVSFTEKMSRALGRD